MTEVEKKTIHCSDDEEDYRLDDLKQENSILRTELTTLYQQFLSTKYDSAPVNNVECSCQTEFDVIGMLESVQSQLKSSTTELAHEKSHNAEQSKLAKEAERRIRDLERKLLDMNVELFKATPLRDKVDELTKSSEVLHGKLSSATNEYVNLSVEVKYQKQKVAELNEQLEERHLDYTNQTQKLQAAEVLSAALTKSIEQKDLQLAAASALNSEYQAKLHKDDLQFVKLTGEMGHWERKCESQSKELLRLSEALKTLSSKHEETQLQLRGAMPLAHTTSDSNSVDVSSAESADRRPLPRAASFSAAKSKHTYVLEPHQRSTSYAYGTHSTYATLSTFGTCSGADTGAESPARSPSTAPLTFNGVGAHGKSRSSTGADTGTRTGTGRHSGVALETGSADGYMDTEACACNFPFFGLSPIKHKRAVKKV